MQIIRDHKFITVCVILAVLLVCIVLYAVFAVTEEDIADGETGIAHKIYLSDGALMEEYSKSDLPVDPKTASKIGETSQFEISYISDNLLEIKTDKGASYVNVRR